MTKHEQAEMAALREALAVATASLTSSYPDPVVIPMPNDGSFVNGWTTFGKSDVCKAWQEAGLYGHERHRVGSRHDRASRDYQCSASRIGFILYATELDALIAARRAMEDTAKRELVKLDQRIKGFE